MDPDTKRLYHALLVRYLVPLIIFRSDLERDEFECAAGELERLRGSSWLFLILMLTGAMACAGAFLLANDAVADSFEPLCIGATALSPVMSYSLVTILWWDRLPEHRRLRELWARIEALTGKLGISFGELITMSPGKLRQQADERIILFCELAERQERSARAGRSPEMNGEPSSADHVRQAAEYLQHFTRYGLITPRKPTGLDWYFAQARKRIAEANKPAPQAAA